MSPVDAGFDPRTRSHSQRDYELFRGAAVSPPSRRYFSREDKTEKSDKNAEKEELVLK